MGKLKLTASLLAIASFLSPSFSADNSEFLGDKGDVRNLKRPREEPVNQELEKKKPEKPSIKKHRKDEEDTLPGGSSSVTHSTDLSETNPSLAAEVFKKPRLKEGEARLIEARKLTREGKHEEAYEIANGVSKSELVDPDLRARASLIKAFLLYSDRTQPLKEKKAYKLFDKVSKNPSATLLDRTDATLYKVRMLIRSKSTYLGTEEKAIDILSSLPYVELPEKVVDEATDLLLIIPFEESQKDEIKKASKLTLKLLRWGDNSRE